jgi:hypothetical protein
MITEWLRKIVLGEIDPGLLTSREVTQQIFRFTSQPFGNRQRLPPEVSPFTPEDILWRFAPAITATDRVQFLQANRLALLTLGEILESLVDEGVLERLPVGDPLGDGQPESVAYVVSNAEELKKIFASSKKSK